MADRFIPFSFTPLFFLGGVLWGLLFDSHLFDRSLFFSKVLFPNVFYFPGVFISAAESVCV